MSDSAHTAALGVAQAVFGPLLALGRASLSVGWTDDPSPQRMIEVRPANDSACAITIFAHENQIDLVLGAEGTLREIFARDEVRRLEELRACLEGVAEGRYEEQVEVTSRGATLTGRFADGPAAYIRHGSHALGPPRVTTFEPY